MNFHILLLKYFFKHTDDIFPIITLRKDAKVIFTFQWHAMSFDPLPHFARSELAHRVLQPIPSADILML